MLFEHGKHLSEFCAALLDPVPSHLIRLWIRIQPLSLTRIRDPEKGCHALAHSSPLTPISYSPPFKKASSSCCNLCSTGRVQVKHLNFYEKYENLHTQNKRKIQNLTKN